VIDPTYTSRKVIHIDMDAFYASVEQRDFPELRGKPIAVGGNEKRGVITTASYEARKFGVKSAMPGWKGKSLCPELIFVPLRFDAYREVSRQIRAIFYEYTDLVEPLSLDEAYLDVTINKKNIEFATDIAKLIQDQILKNTELTASAGVSYCKFLAKIASDYRKPSGLTVIKPHQAERFIESLAVEKFFGVGKVTAAKMHELGIYKGLDLKSKSVEELTRHFGKSGNYFYNVSRGVDTRQVEPNRIRKSMAFERTYEEYISTYEEALSAFQILVERFYKERIQKHNFIGKTLTLKIKDADFNIKSRSITKNEGFKSFEEINYFALKLLNENKGLITSIRLLGLTISNEIEN
jgi:DNA polymerase IV